MRYDAVVVGAGAGGLTAAAYLARAGHSVLLCEKEPTCGGLVSSFTRDGFTYDGGIRALEDAGVLFTMLRQLGLDLEMVPNRISIGIEDRVIEIASDADLNTYADMLTHFYPNSAQDIKAITAQLRRIMTYMDIQYGIDNPLFLDPKTDRKYFIREVFPWMFRYARTVGKVMALNKPVLDYLRQFTDNQSLLDIIAQHFFTGTPAYFALSYIKLYQDYHYPLSGTGAFTKLMVDFIQKHNGIIRTNTEVTAVDLENRSIRTSSGEEIHYRQLIWAADQKRLYGGIDDKKILNKKIRAKLKKRRDSIKDMKGNDSVLTLYLSCDLDPNDFREIATGHFFYTASRKGQSAAGKVPINGNWQEIKIWLKKWFPLTTYEIAIPVLRDPSLAPPGKTGLIISVLFDYALTKHIYDNRWEDKFKRLVTEQFTSTLDNAIYPGLARSARDSFLSTPLTLQKIAGTTEGAITGWSFTNHPMPAEQRLARIANAANTSLPNLHQAGQWTYSPAGFPVALITGKLAADKAIKTLKKRSR